MRAIWPSVKSQFAAHGVVWVHRQRASELIAGLHPAGLVNCIAISIAVDHVIAAPGRTSASPACVVRVIAKTKECPLESSVHLFQMSFGIGNLLRLDIAFELLAVLVEKILEIPR